MSKRKRSKHDPKGRTKNGRFILIDHGLLSTDAFLHLSGDALKLLLLIWKRHDGHNNGNLSFSVREAMRAIPCRSEKARRLFAELQDKGFIRCTLPSNIDWKEGRAREWRLTMEKAGDDPPTREFNHWRPDKHIPVSAADTDRTDSGYGGKPLPSTYAGNRTDSGYGSPPVPPSDRTDSGYTYNTTRGAAAASGQSGRIEPVAQPSNTSSSPSDFGSFIKQQRQQRGLGVGDLAQRAGIGRSTLSNIEAGRYTAGEQSRAALLDALAKASEAQFGALV